MAEIERAKTGDICIVRWRRIKERLEMRENDLDGRKSYGEERTTE